MSRQAALVVRGAVVFVCLSVAFAAGLSGGEEPPRADAAQELPCPTKVGDMDGDQKATMTDAIQMLLCLFAPEKCPMKDVMVCPAQRVTELEAQLAACESARAQLERQVTELTDEKMALEEQLRACREGLVLPDTGQTRCFTTRGDEISCTDDLHPDQDAAYQTGCPMEGRFVDNGDGTVTDRCTGLMWQKAKADVNGDDTSDDNDAATWQDALTHCCDLILTRNGIWTTDLQEAADNGGVKYDDWRLPNANELYSILDFGKDRLVDVDLFEISDGWRLFWTSTTYTMSTASAAVILFGRPWASDPLFGPVSWSGKESECFVRAVRIAPTPIPHAGLVATGQTGCWGTNGNPDPGCADGTHPGQDGFYQAGCSPKDRFFDNGDGTLTDNCTGIMWQQQTADVNGDDVADENDRATWQGALAYCENLELAGYTDWRLPNVMELQGIVDYGRNVDIWGPGIDPAFHAVPFWYWTSSTDVQAPLHSYVVNFYSLFVSNFHKTGTWYVRAVRGGLDSR